MHLIQEQNQGFDLQNIRNQLGNDWSAMDDEIITQLSSDVALVSSVANYIVQSGGKRLRPLLVLLSARACGYQGQQHVRAAAIIEFIHTATLLHDDVVDESTLRRGQNTANAVFGSSASILVGDFLYSRSFQMMVQLGQMRIMEILAEATNTIAEGEVLQLMNCNDPDTTEAQYMEVIKRKTAKLFDAGMLIGAILADQTRSVEDAMSLYGRKLGTAFQLADDALDYSSNNKDLGKNIGDDLAEGKPTLPLIHALRKGSPSEQVAIRTAIEEGGLHQLDTIIAAIGSSGALGYTMQQAKKFANEAVAALDKVPDSPFKESLIRLAHFAAKRSY